MIKFTQNEDDCIQFDMPREDYNLMLLLVGYSLAVIKQNDHELFWPALEFVNELNAGNPNFAPYQIPEEHRGKRDRLRLIVPLEPLDWS